jgi:hypothetical protein
VTDPLSPGSSGPPTPSHSSVQIPLSSSIGSTTAGSHTASSPPPSPLNASVTPLAQPSQYTSPHLPTPNLPYSYPPPGVAVPVPSSISHSLPSSGLEGARLSGRLVGVVSLTDILNLHARASGLNPADPAESRIRRRRSSSSSQSIRRSGDIGRELFSRGL